MNLRARLGRIALAMLLGVFVAGVLASPALAENRGHSGLPPGPGNPIAKLQQEINALTQQITELARLGQSVAALTQQVAQLGQLGQSVAALTQQMAQLGQLGQSVSALTQQMAQLQQQVTTLQQQATAYASLQQQVNALNGQVASLNTQIASLNTRLGSLGPSNALAVFDAHDKKIGDVVGVQDDIPWVSLTASGQVVALRVFSGQLLGGFVWFSGASCTGSAYVSDTPIFNGADVFALAAVREPGGVIYAADAKTPVQRAQVQSLAQHDGTCFTFSSPVTNSVVPATPVMTLDLLFSRPYSVH